MSEKSKLIREMRLFEFYSRYLWPLHRKIVGARLAKRCQVCFLSENYVPLIDGICDLCLSNKQEIESVSESEQQAMQAEMDRRLSQTIAAKPSAYHALVLFSGGKDSSYLLYRLQTDYPKLRLLAVTIDNTFMSPVALENSAAIVQRFGIDHLLVRPKAATMEKMFRHAFTHLNAGGCSGTVDQFDGDFFSDVARHIAAEKKIPYVICGLSRTQVTRILKLRSFLTTPESESLPRTHVAGIDLKTVFDDQEMTYWWNPSRYPKADIPLLMFPFYIWNPEEAFIKSEVLRLRLMPRGDESPLITNNRLIPLMGIVDNIHLGYSSFEPEFAEMVRAGKADRKQWLHSFEMVEYAAQTGKFISKSLDEVLQRLGLTRSELKIKG